MVLNNVEAAQKKLIKKTKKKKTGLFYLRHKIKKLAQ